jgi:hypothetical protein
MKASHWARRSRKQSENPSSDEGRGSNGRPPEKPPQRVPSPSSISHHGPTAEINIPPPVPHRRLLLALRASIYAGMTWDTLWHILARDLGQCACSYDGVAGISEG